MKDEWHCEFARRIVQKLAQEGPRRHSTPLVILVGISALLASVAPARAQEVRVVRLSDAVGDTIDRAERDSFGLFPRTPGFLSACILLASEQHYVEVAFQETSVPRTVFLRVSSTQVERLGYLVENHDYVRQLLAGDPSVVRTHASYWEAVEANPLSAVDGSPVHVAFTTPVGATRPGDRVALPTSWIVTGALIGCCLGGTTGFLVSWNVTGGSPYGSGCMSLDPPFFRDYAFDNATCCIVTGAGIAVGAGGGCLLGRLVESRRHRSRAAVGDRTETGTAAAEALPNVGNQPEHEGHPADSLTAGPATSGRHRTE